MNIMFYTWYQRLPACHVHHLLIDFKHVWLTLAISVHGNIYTRVKKNFFMNLTSVIITSSETFSLILFIKEVYDIIVISKTFKFEKRWQY